MTDDKKTNNYDNESIRKLTDLEAVRSRVSVYAGSADKDGAFTTVKEIISNSIDEFKEGHGDVIEIIQNSDESITVIDNGRGLPMDWNENEEEYNYKLLLFTLNAGGKYDSNNYGYSIGLNGIGSSLSIMSSEFAEIQSIRDGNIYTVQSKKGMPEGDMEVQKNKEKLPNGTIVKWKPDTEVFDEIDFPDEWFLEYIKRQAIVNKGLKITFTNKKGETFEELYKNGIKDYIKELSDDKNFTSDSYIETDDILGRDRKDRDEYKSKFEVAYAFNNENYAMESYHNSSYLSEGGSPHDAVKSAFIHSIDRLIKRLDKYNSGEKKISFLDIEESLIIITNTYSTETQYKNQTKLAISNKFIRDKLNEILRNSLQVFFVENPIEAEKVAEQVLANKRSRESAEKSRIDVRERLTSKNVNSIVSKIEDYYPTKNRGKKGKKYLAIVEGKSALSSIVYGRDANEFAVYPIRGKSLNVRKQSDRRIMSNQEIQDIYNILGCGVDLGGKPGSKTNNFDIDNLLFDRIYIYADADVDGNHISGLLLSIFDKLSPELIKQGKVYQGVTPYFTVTETASGKIHYIYTQDELEELQDRLGSKKHTVAKNKGLGSLSSEAISLAMKVENSHHVEYVYDDLAEETLNLWFKGAPKERRKMMFEDYEED